MRCGTSVSNQKGETAQDISLNENGDCLLHIACMWDDPNIVGYLITKEKCNTNVQSSTSKNTPLHIAVKYGQDDTTVQLLLHNKCDPNLQNKEGDTPLHLAVGQSNTAAISQLLAYHEYKLANVKNKEGDTPLHIACSRKSLDIIKLLLESKCSTNLPNMKGETAQDIPLNEDGDCLLHIACQWGNVGIVKYLITDEKCNPNIESFTSKNTPLHIAAKYGQDDTVFLLLSFQDCDPNVQNKCGNTPLHLAAKYGQDHTIVQLLCKGCNLNVQNKEGSTPLHFAVQQNKVATVSKLLAYQQCNPDVQNWEGDTPLHIACCMKLLDVIKLFLDKRCSIFIPNNNGKTAQYITLNEDGDRLLHISCYWDNVDIVRYITTYQNDLNVTNMSLNTPLHIACHVKSLNTIRFLLEKRCNTNNPNIKGETAQDIPLNEDGDCLLHIACQWGDVAIVGYLITDEKCNPNVQSCNSKNTPLHVAVKYEQDEIICQLLSYQECDPAVQNKDGDTPLHIAVRQSKATAVSQLLAHHQCNINVQNKVGNTPLHIIAETRNEVEICELIINHALCDMNILNKDCLTPLLMAIKHNNSLVSTALLQHKKCDCNLCDQHGNTPLHLACIGGETWQEMVEVAKQLLISVDVSCVNNAGQTPIQLTTNYQIIRAVLHLVKCKRTQSIQTYINVFVVGNPETGKSTLVKAICKEAFSILWKIIPKRARRVKNVPLHTAGIVPTTLRSKKFGNTVLYDLAGQIEYYTSHSAVIKSTVISTPPAFIVVVNLSESEEKIGQTLRYWWSFINNHALQSSALPHVILVGSHVDIVRSTGRSVTKLMTQLSAVLKQLPASFHYVGEVALDCRDPASGKLQRFCSLVNQSCTVLRQKADVDLHCHVLYAFLLDKYQGKVSCTVSDVATSVKENRELLPQNPDSLIPLLSTLSDKGLLLLVKGGENHGDWWIILQKQTLLHEINGAIFAPKHFSQYRDLSWNTGVVPFSKLKNEFTDYVPNMVAEFLIHLEFCFKIEDHQTLVLLRDEAANMKDTPLELSEEYYFFPALVSVENPLHVWEQDDNMCCKCGWFFQCTRRDQFLTTQFLHVLILRLAFTFALRLNPGDSREAPLYLRRKCSVWKHGIGWLDRVPIETVVEVGLQHQSVIVMMRCPKDEKAKCVQMRSEVIQKVIEAKDEHCKAVEMSESFVHFTNIKYPFISDIENVKYYSLTEIAKAIVEQAANALDQEGRNPIPIQDLLLFDPYTTDTNTLTELFSKKHSMDEKVRTHFLETLNCESEESMCLSSPCIIMCFLYLVGTPQLGVLQDLDVGSEPTCELRVRPLHLIILVSVLAK